MSCKLVRRHLGAFVDGELDPATQVEFERHLEVCPGCQEHHAFEGSLREQTRASIGDIHAPDHLWGRALHRLGRDRRGEGGAHVVDPREADAVAPDLADRGGGGGDFDHRWCRRLAAEC